ncbi:Periplasmic beta-glucosidase [Neolecta irregularis DAH-3]|uniref:beta-glucosidase n=1 Tax=Neolecta irregularis (strain DAH-3) TaxID=1198029 RepID=A0A1U7LSJ7_NEOID|nr:Periplasmic beta-glucosidase [Neolecta irregularis DAH-3]|eukprot:OLL25588.1 Periplasmic beta-glucosidase [Neolecta irregularis DAH-3]
MMFLQVINLSLLSLVSSTTHVHHQRELPVYRDPSKSIDQRVEDLLSRMTDQEKLSQLMQGDQINWYNDTSGAFNKTGLIDSMNSKGGSFYVGEYLKTIDMYAEAINYGQHVRAVRRHEIDSQNSIDGLGLHGLVMTNATIFTSPIGLGATFNPQLIEKMAEAIAEEAAVVGINNLFSPNVDLARELRFGRTEETFGEDPYLTGEMAYAYVVGLQRSRKVAAMPKHFAAFSSPQGGLNLAPVPGGERELRTIYLPPFKRAIMDAEATMIMSAYDGIPSIANHHLLTEILRNEWGYKYAVMCDSGATDLLSSQHGLCATGDEDCIATISLNSGVDIEMGGGSFNYKQIPRLVSEGKLEQKAFDDAVRRILSAKFKLGLFDTNHKNTSFSNSTGNYFKVINTQMKKDLAKAIDSEAMILLENNGVLPLDSSSLKSIALIGPFANANNYGDYVVQGSKYRGITPLDGIQNLIKTKFPNIEVKYTEGCKQWSNDQSGFAAAEQLAQEADVAIVFVGTWSRDQSELWAGLNATTGEHVDQSSLDLVGAQADLVRAVSAKAKKLVTVLTSGTAITEPWITNVTHALLQTFYPGEQGGAALADILFGLTNPSGKLPISLPRSVGTTPAFYNYLKGARPIFPGFIQTDGALNFGHQYVLNSPVPWYPFGHGLSYSNFTIKDAVLSATNVPRNGKVEISVTVQNNGIYEGKEVIQAYVIDVVSSVVTSERSLRAFNKVSLKPKESTSVQLTIDVSELAVWSIKNEFIIEPGQFQILVGTSSAQIFTNSTFYVI